MTECKFVTKNSCFKILVVFASTFVADTKITFVYSFVAPPSCLKDIDKDVPKLSDISLTKVILFGDSKYSDIKNHKI